jgi:prevent-host-death family protein
MTLHDGNYDDGNYEVGVRALHDRLSEHLDRVEKGADILVTRRGRPIARLSAVDREDPMHELVRRGIVMPPSKPRQRRRARVKPRSSVSELVAEQRR